MKNILLFIITMSLNLYAYDILSYEGGDSFIIDTSIVEVGEGEQEYAASVVSNGENYLVVWYKDSDNKYKKSGIYGKIISKVATKNKNSFQHIFISPDSGETKVVSDSNTYLVVWKDMEIKGKRILDDGEILDSIPVIFSSYCDGEAFDIIFDGDNYFLVYTGHSSYGDSTYLKGVKITKEGKVLNSTERIIAAYNGSSVIENVKIALRKNFLSPTLYYFIVWDKKEGETSNIYGRRLSENGVFLDTEYIEIAKSSKSKTKPLIAFDGINFLVIWVENGREIYGKRISQDGEILDSIPILMASPLTYAEIKPHLYFNEINYVLSWNWEGDYGCCSGITVKEISRDGIPDTNEYSIIEDRQITNYATVYQNNECIYIWDSNEKESGVSPDNNVFFMRFDKEFNPIDSVAILVSSMANEQYHPEIAFDGENYLGLWFEKIPHNRDYRWGIKTIKIGADGEIKSNSRVALSYRDYEISSWSSLIYGESNYLFSYVISLWTDEIWYAILSKEGEVVKTEYILGGEFFISKPLVSFDGDNYFIVWEDRREGKNNISFIRITSDGELLDSLETVVCSNKQNKFLQGLCFGKENYLLLWSESVDSSEYSALMSIRISSEGEAIDKEPKKLIDSIRIKEHLHSYVSFDGKNYLFVWIENSRNEYKILGVRINRNNAIIDSIPVQIYETKNVIGELSIKFYKDRYIILWDEDTENDYDIYGIELDPNLKILKKITIEEKQGGQFQPVMAINNENDVLILYSGWTEKINDITVNVNRIRGKFYNSEGIEEEDFYPEGVTLNVEYSLTSSHISVYYSIPFDSEINFKIFDISGRCIKNIRFKERGGEYKFIFNTEDLSAGVYFISLSIRDKILIDRFMKIK